MEGDIDAHVAYRKSSKISIHALRVEGDPDIYLPIVKREISIHALRVEGDHGRVGFPVDLIISIHALRVEGDLKYV